MNDTMVSVDKTTCVVVIAICCVVAIAVLCAAFGNGAACRRVEQPSRETIWREWSRPVETVEP
jgi:hypothetical protein